MPLINGVLCKSAKETFVPGKSEKRSFPQVTCDLKVKKWDFSKLQLWDIEDSTLDKGLIIGTHGSYISSIKIPYFNLSSPPLKQYSLDPQPFNALYGNGPHNLPHLLNPQSGRDRRITAFCYRNQSSLIVAYGQSIEVLFQDNHIEIPSSPRLNKPLKDKYQIDSSLFRHVFKTNKVLAGHSEDITSLIMLPGDRLASAAKDKKIKIWSIEKKTCLFEFKVNVEVEHLLLTHDLKLISAGQKYIHVWDITQYKLIRKFTLLRPVLGIGLLTDQRLAISQIGEPIILLDLDNGKTTPVLTHFAAYQLKVLPHDHLAYTKDTGELELCVPEATTNTTRPETTDNEHYILTSNLAKKSWISWRLSLRPLKFQEVVPSLKQLDKAAVKKLNLQNMVLNDADIPELLIYLNQSKLVELDIRNTSLTFVGIKALYLGLDSHPTLKKLLHTSLSATEQCHLAECYERGKGIPPDLNKASVWYHPAALRGNAYAQFRLGAYYANTSSPAYNIIEAIRWYLMAAKNNPIDALYYLAAFHSKSVRIIKSLTTAFNYYYTLAIKSYPIRTYHVAPDFSKDRRTEQLRIPKQGKTSISLKTFLPERQGSVLQKIAEYETRLVKMILQKADSMTQEYIQPIMKIIQAICVNLNQINLVIDRDPVALKEQEIIDSSSPALREYQKYLETELCRFITAYWIASTGLLMLTENKKGELLKGVTHLLGSLPGVGVLLQIVPMALQELNHHKRASQINNLVKLFTNVDDIARICRQFARKFTLVKKDEILSLAALEKDQGRLNKFLNAGKEFFHALRNNLRKLNRSGLKLTAAQELGILHGALLIEKIMSEGLSEAESIGNDNLVTRLIKVMGHEPPLTIIAAATSSMEISIEMVALSPSTATPPADSTTNMVRSLLESVNGKPDEQMQARASNPSSLAGNSTPPSTKVVQRTRFFHLNEQITQLSTQFTALQGRVRFLEEENAQLQAGRTLKNDKCVIL